MEQPLIKKINKQNNHFLYGLFILLTIIFIFNIIILVNLTKFNELIENDELMIYIRKLKKLINEACKDIKC